MSDTDTETQAETTPVTEPAAAGDGSAVSNLEAKVDHLAELVAGLLKSKPSAEAEEEAGSVADEVKRELAKLKAAEDRKKSAAERDGKVAELEATVKKLTEKPPREYRKITSRLWGSDE